uniref:N-acetyltransferase n=1 Tax=Thermosporothrix sp. COM3 TaxID=2490863 RepID=A0A455SI49_9CHLR|nr:N-acetyltransferase [Thermosporothrix sp. COM3]
MLQPLQTARLQFVPYSLELKKATLSDREQVERALGVRVPAHWPEPDFREALPFFIGLMEQDASGAIWDGIIIHTADQQVIGDMGFKGGPDEQGQIEIGYSILPEYRQRGYATEMAQALMDWAFRHLDITAIVAECLHDNYASIKVLEKLGMQRQSADGELLKWKRENPLR